MTLGRNMSVTTVSSKPCFLRSSTMYSMQGLPQSDTIGLGWLLVSGRRRVPSPPAMTTARTGLTFTFARGDAGTTVRLSYPAPRLLHPHDGPVAVQQAAGHVERRAHGEEAPAEDAQVEDEPLDRADEDEVAGLAPAADLRALVREAARRDDQRQDDAVADQQRQHGPPRQRAEVPEHGDEREEEEAVDDRVHPAAELALHVVPARDEAIGDVAERREEDDPGGRPGSARRVPGVRPDDERQRQEPGDGEDIGHVAHEALHAGQSSRRGGQATQPPLPGGRADRPGGLC